MTRRQMQAAERISGLEDFVAAALDFGKRQANAVVSRDRTPLQLGKSWFSFSESQPLLTADAAYCFGSTANRNASGFAGCIHADYSGWHIQAGHAEQISRTETLIELDAHLSRRGWRASFSTDRNTWDLFDLSDRFGLRLLPSPKAQAEWERTAPLAHFCKWMAQENGQVMIHAASVAANGKGALLVGPGGAGKSGTTLGLMKHGFSSAGDDYVLISPSGAQNVYRTVKQDPTGLKRLGLPTDLPLNWQNKAVFRPEQVNIPAISDSAPVNAILVPVLGSPKTRLSRIDPATAFRLLTFSTLRQLGSDYASVFESCGKLVRALPCYKLELSDDPKDIAATMSEFLESLAC